MFVHQSRRIVFKNIYISLHPPSRTARTLSKRKTHFPHGFSANEPLVPRSTDGSTPITDALPRSPLLDPSTYESKSKYRKPQPNKDPDSPLSDFEKQVVMNPFGNCPSYKYLSFQPKFSPQNHAPKEL